MYAEMLALMLAALVAGWSFVRRGTAKNVLLIGICGAIVCLVGGLVAEAKLAPNWARLIAVGLAGATLVLVEYKCAAARKQTAHLKRLHADLDRRTPRRKRRGASDVRLMP
ncbi:MAG: hypothetical protein ACYS22_01210 [Planctomycetota bacterium]